MTAQDLSRRAALISSGVLLASGFAHHGWARSRKTAGLSDLLCDGPDGVLSAGLILRGPDGRVLRAEAVGQRITGTAAGDVVQPFGLGDPFRTASISKLITTTGFMLLVEQGRVGLEDDASAHLDFRLRHPAWPDRPITIRQLLSHTSALRNGPSYPVPAGHKLSEAFLANGRNFDGGAWFGPSEHAPGDWFAYADVNFCLIAQILERKTGERFDHYMSHRLFEPLGLDIGYNWSGVSQGKRNRAASARRWIDGRWTEQTDGRVSAAPEVAFPQPKDLQPLSDGDLKPGENGFLFSPLGGLRLSLRDLDRLAVLYRNGGRLGDLRVIDEATLKTMCEPVWRYDPGRPNGETDGGVFGGYGLGVECPQGISGPTGDAFFGPASSDWRGHLGDAYGWMTALFWNRRTGASLVYALNGMRETDRPQGRHCALTGPEEAIIDLAMRDLDKA